MSFDIKHQIFLEMAEDSEAHPSLKKAILVSAKRDPVVRSVEPLIDWLYSRLIREREWRIKAEEQLKGRPKPCEN
jgi:hypothetical protein